MSPESIQIVYLVLLALELAVGQGLTVANMGHLRRLRDEPPRAALALMGPEEYRKSVDYTLERGRLSLASAAVHAGVLLLLVRTGWLGALERFIYGLGIPFPPNLASVLFV
ncbi:MAG: hypothetical protein JW820_20480, partial [Spirochaetales bacterium]|nr:hypothetical protein [Spirochaetales bacterium]